MSNLQKYMYGYNEQVEDDDDDDNNDVNISELLDDLLEQLNESMPDCKICGEKCTKNAEICDECIRIFTENYTMFEQKIKQLRKLEKL